jgi:hypothetical protein
MLNILVYLLSVVGNHEVFHNLNMDPESRFSANRKFRTQSEEEMPKRLQSIMSFRPESLTPKKKFLPNTAAVRIPKKLARKKSSELAAERPRSSSFSEISHSLSSKVLISHSNQDPRTVVSRTFKRQPEKVAFRLAGESGLDKIVKNQEKERSENTWLSSMEVDQYAPLTLPFFNQNNQSDERKMEDGNLFIVQLPDLLPAQGFGKVGKMRVYKSGKIEMVIEDQVFNVFNGVQSTFYQEVARIAEDLVVLGPVKSQLVVAPKV